MKWTGRPRHWGDWPGLATYLAGMNTEFVLPLGERELGGIVKSIQRIQSKNLQSGQTQRTFSFLQAARGKKSGQARRKRTADRDAAIVAAVQAGESTGSATLPCATSSSGVRYEPKQDEVPWGLFVND